MWKDSPSLSRQTRTTVAVGAILAAAVLVFAFPRLASAHCDSMDGPIVPTALKALESGEIASVLKWVRKQDEDTIRSAFERVRGIRSQGGEARQIAELWFLETLVRVHREGEGEPYTGLKPAGSMDPIFAAADEALDSGSVDELAAKMASAVSREIHERFDLAREKRKRAEESAELGRDFVAAYVAYMHFVEGIHHFVRHGASDHHFTGSPEPSERSSPERHDGD